MGRRSRQQRAYYSVFSVKDGTIWHASVKRRPHGAAPGDFDEDGIFNVFVDRLGEELHYSDTAKVVRGATLANCLNLKRELRERVEARLAALAGQMTALQVQLDRIEQRLDRCANAKAIEMGDDADE
jgi:hypothetical protein